jgi:hypothetical protein
MPSNNKGITEAAIISGWKECPSITGLARRLGCSHRSLANRIAMLRGGPRAKELQSVDRRSKFYAGANLDQHPAVIQLGLRDGHILIGSDSHYWPGVDSVAHDAFLEFCREFKPKVVIKNGDEADFPTISRHAPIAWETRPKPAEEIDNLKAMLGEIEKTAKGARFIWPLGNHDSRFETRLATVAPEYANVHGVHLKDNFPKWEPCWAAFVNQDVVVKHRYKSGIHAPHNNTLWAGRTMVTGHLHALKVQPISDYNGTRWGVDTGTMAAPYGPQFYNYTEMNPLNWRAGFVLLTFIKGKLLWPELVWVSGPGTVQFRGKEWGV